MDENFLISRMIFFFHNAETQIFLRPAERLTKEGVHTIVGVPFSSIHKDGLA
jgi:hypothetical protein